MFCDLLDGLPGVLVGGGLNSLSSILASFTYWHDFPSSTMLLSTFRDINLKPERHKHPLWELPRGPPCPPAANGGGEGLGRKGAPGAAGWVPDAHVS